MVVDADRRKLDAMSRTHAHQGVIALAAVREYATVEQILQSAADRGEAPLLVVCDEISDPHNLGAILRTAECAGAHGVIIPKRRSAGLTAIVAKTSAGAVSYIPVARVPNIPALLKDLKKAGRVGVRYGGGREYHAVQCRSEGAGGHCHRLRGDGHDPPGGGELRFSGEHPHERKDILAECQRGGGHTAVRGCAAARITESDAEQDENRKEQHEKATDEELYGAFDEQEDELSLEAILAEYGKGGRQPVPTEEAAIPETPAEKKAPVPVSEAVPPSETEAPSEPAAPEKNEPEYESPAPDRVALKDIMSQTVDAVLEDEDDGVIAQPVPLRNALRHCWRGFAVRQRSRGAVRLSGHRAAVRRAGGGTGAGGTAGAGAPAGGCAAGCQAPVQPAARRTDRGMLPALALVTAAVLQELEKLPSAWLDESLLRCAALGRGCC